MALQSLVRAVLGVDLRLPASAGTVGGATTGGVETPDEEQVSASTDERSPAPQRISDETFTRVAPGLLRRMLRSGKGGFGTRDLASSLRVTSGTVIAVARRLNEVLQVGRPAGRSGGAYYVTVRDGKSSDVEAMVKQWAREARRAHHAPKPAASSPDLSWLGSEDDPVREVPQKTEDPASAGTGGER